MVVLANEEEYSEAADDGIQSAPRVEPCPLAYTQPLRSSPNVTRCASPVPPCPPRKRLVPFSPRLPRPQRVLSDTGYFTTRCVATLGDICVLINLSRARCERYSLFSAEQYTAKRGDGGAEREHADVCGFGATWYERLFV